MSKMQLVKELCVSLKCGGVLQCKTVQNETDRQTVDLKDSMQSFQSASVSFKRFIGIYIEFPVPSSFLFYIWQPNMTHWRGEKKQMCLSQTAAM